jgi:DNA-binding MarR family transcriptional regulator
MEDNSMENPDKNGKIENPDEKIQKEIALSVGQSTAVIRMSKKKINKLNRLFCNLSVVEYLILWNLLKYKDEHGSDIIYLSCLADELNIPVAKVSQIVKRLERKGLVLWEFNEDGTYITFPQATIDSATEQEKILRDFMKKVTVAYGEEEFKKLVNDMVKFSKTIDQELDNYKGLW